jgi:hypothetical protein
MEETFSVAKSLCFQVLGIAAAFVAMSVIPGTIPAQQPAAAPPAQHIDPQARQLLDRAIQAMGGQAFLNAKSLTTRGRVFFFADGNTAGVQPFESWFEYPDKRRFSYGKSKPVILINSEGKGWELDQYGLIVQPDDQIKNWNLSNRYSLENVLRVRVNDPGVLIQTGSADFVDNTPTQGIEITAPGGTSVRLDLHRQTFVPSRISYRVWNAKINDWDEYTDAYSDFKTVDGILTAMHITRYLNGDRIGETFRNSAQYNETYPANYFRGE